MDTKTNALDMTADIISAFVSNNSVTVAELPALIQNVFAALNTVSSGGEPVAEAPREPAVTVKKSVTPDFLICLEDGLKFKSLKRHLQSKYNLNPDEYRAKWNLPKTYPMVAPNYAAARSRLAKEAGLGQGGRQEAKKAPARAKGRLKGKKI